MGLELAFNVLDTTEWVEIKVAGAAGEGAAVLPKEDAKSK